MFHQLKTLTLLVAMLFAANGYAQSIAELQATVAASKGKLSAINAEQNDLQAALNDINQQIEAIADLPSPEKQAYQQAQQDLQAAESIYKAEGTDESKAKMNNAQFKLALAERKYKKSNQALAELSDQQSELQTKLANNQQLNAKLSQQIKTNNQKISQLTQQQAERNKALQTARKNKELEAQRAEVARLKAALQASEKEKASLVANQKAAKTAVAATSAAAVAAASKATAPVPAPSISKASPAAKPANVTPPAAAAVKTPKPSASTSTDNNKSAIYLTSKQAIVDLEKRLSIILATEDKEKTAYSRMLNIKPADQASKVKIRAQTLESLGHGQYKGDGPLLAGDTIFAVGFYRWRQEINHQYGSQFTFLLDISDSKNPKLYYYPSSLGK